MRDLCAKSAGSPGQSLRQRNGSRAVEDCVFVTLEPRKHKYVVLDYPVEDVGSWSKPLGVFGYVYTHTGSGIQYNRGYPVIPGVPVCRSTRP